MLHSYIEKMSFIVIMIVSEHESKKFGKIAIMVIMHG